MTAVALLSDTWRLTRYHSMHYWSPVHGCRVGRFWMFDARGDEYFAIVAMDGTGKKNKAARLGALEAIEKAMVDGDQPGEVKVSEDGPRP